MDVTNPEAPPKLLAEITHEDLGFTTSMPTIMKSRTQDGNGGFTEGGDGWYLVFGSGPAGNDENGRREALNLAKSEKTAKVFVFDLDAREEVELVAELEENSFTGGFTSEDWDRNYQDDAFYFGVIGPEDTENGGFAGSLRRGAPSRPGSDNFNVDYLLDDSVNLPFSAAPLTYRDILGEYWVFAGTGRFFVPEDNLTVQQNYFYGIKELRAHSDPTESVPLEDEDNSCLLYTSPSPRDLSTSRMPSSA